jgi:hypothetical protein
MKDRTSTGNDKMLEYNEVILFLLKASTFLNIQLQ